MLNKQKASLSITVAAFLCLVLLGLVLFANHPLNSDEGVILNGAWHLFNGRSIYVDFFEFITPLSFYLVFWFWKIFGVSYFSAKVLAIFIVLFSSFGVFKIAKKVLGNWFFPLIPAFLFVFVLNTEPIINHNVFAVFFAVWAVYFFMEGLDGFRSPFFILSGISTGFCIMALQSRGIALFIFLLLFLLLVIYIRRLEKIYIRPAFYYFIFSFLPTLPLFLKWPLTVLYQDLFIFPVFNYSAVNKVPLLVFIFFIAANSFIALFLLLNKEKSLQRWLLVFLQYALLFSILTRPDFFHVATVIFPLSILVLIFPEVSDPKKRFWLLDTAFYGFSVLIIAAFYNFTPAVVMSLSDLPNFFYQRQPASDVFAFIEANCPGKYIYSGPFLPGLYFETRKLNPTPYSILVTNQQTEEQFKSAVADLKKYQPTCALLNYPVVKKFGYNIDNPVDNYIFQNYTLVLSPREDLLIYKKN